MTFLVIAYLDTCVWLSAFFSKDSKHEEAVDIIRTMTSVPNAVIVSHHVLNEILDVLKHKVAPNNPRTRKTRLEAATWMENGRPH